MATQTRPAPAPSAPPAFEPFVPPSQSPAELTVRAVILGAILGIVFAASSVYLALKIGLTVSASIPIAVLAVAFFRTLGTLHHPGEQHRPDHRLGRRVDRGGDRLHAAGDSVDGLRPDVGKVAIDRGDRRPARRPDDDPAPPRPDREGARQPHLPRGHGLRRGADRGRQGRTPGPAALPGVRPRLPLQVPDVRAQGCGRSIPAGSSKTSTRAPPSPPRSRPSCWAWATSSAPGSPGICLPAARWRTWC